MARLTEEQFKAIEGAAWRKQSVVEPQAQSASAREALPTPRHKFNAKKTDCDGIRFDSKAVSGLIEL